MPNFNPEAKF